MKKLMKYTSKVLLLMGFFLMPVLTHAATIFTSVPANYSYSGYHVGSNNSIYVPVSLYGQTFGAVMTKESDSSGWTGNDVILCLSFSDSTYNCSSNLTSSPVFNPAAAGGMNVPVEYDFDTPINTTTLNPSSKTVTQIFFNFTSQGNYMRLYGDNHQASPDPFQPDSGTVLYNQSGGSVDFEIADAGGFITPPDPDLTGNQVVRYWPDAGIATSTGVTTIGAQFNINRPDWIVGVGYELDGGDESGLIVNLHELYIATTTVTTPQKFSFTTDYNFTTAGHYFGQAFFIQRQTVYNPDGTASTTKDVRIDIQQQQVIAVDTNDPGIVINPNGTISNPSFATSTVSSTSPLYLLNIQCSDDLVGNACKIFNFIFNPDLSYLKVLRDDVSAIFTKFPFNIFTSTYNFINPALTTAASSGTGTGSLNLTFYGNTASVISSSSLAAAGVNSSALSGIRLLMTAGLWFLFVWYLFWRGTKLLDRFRRFV